MGSRGQGRVGTETGPGQHQLLTEIFWPERGGIMHSSENVSNLHSSSLTTGSLSCPLHHTPQSRLSIALPYFQTMSSEMYQNDRGEEKVTFTRNVKNKYYHKLLTVFRASG